MLLSVAGSHFTSCGGNVSINMTKTYAGNAEKTMPVIFFANKFHAMITSAIIVSFLLQYYHYFYYEA
jgi:hypothetical protein